MLGRMQLRSGRQIARKSTGSGTTKPRPEEAAALASASTAGAYPRLPFPQEEILAHSAEAEPTGPLVPASPEPSHERGSRVSWHTPASPSAQWDDEASGDGTEALEEEDGDLATWQAPDNSGVVSEGSLAEFAAAFETDGLDPSDPFNPGSRTPPLVLASSPEEDGEEEESDRSTPQGHLRNARKRLREEEGVRVPEPTSVVHTSKAKYIRLERRPIARAISPPPRPSRERKCKHKVTEGQYHRLKSAHQTLLEEHDRLQARLVALEDRFEDIERVVEEKDDALRALAAQLPDLASLAERGLRATTNRSPLSSED